MDSVVVLNILHSLEQAHSTYSQAFIHVHRWVTIIIINFKINKVTITMFYYLQRYWQSYSRHRALFGVSEHSATMVSAAASSLLPWGIAQTVSPVANDTIPGLAVLKVLLIFLQSTKLWLLYMHVCIIMHAFMIIIATTVIIIPQCMLTYVVEKIYVTYLLHLILLWLKVSFTQA